MSNITTRNAWSALTLLVVRHKKLSDEVLAWLSGKNNLHMVQMMPLPPHYLLLH